MPSALSLVLAEKLKTPYVFDVDAAVAPQEAREWFRRTGGRSTNFISYTDIAWHSEKEYLAWRRVDEDRITHSCTLTAKLHEWVREHTREEIATVLDRIPPGLGADPDTGKSFNFGAWQRLAAAHWSSHLFDVTSTVHVSTTNLRDLAQYNESELRGSARKIPIGSQMSMIKGSCPDKFICDLGTAGGKTSWSIAAATSKLIGNEFERLKNEYRDKSSGTFVKGPAVPNVARMVVIATAGTTFQHFVTTAKRMVPRIESMDPTIVVHVWDKLGKQCTTTVAASLPSNVLLLWVVPVEHIIKVLRHDPSVTIPVVITDEFTVNTPKERSATDQSFVMKNLITQATPQALQEATNGNRSWLKDEFGGGLHAPRRLKSLIGQRNFKEAQLAATQITKLDLMTLTPFRCLVRDELCAMIPVGILVTFVSSRRLTMLSHLTNAASDVVPANFTNMLLTQLSSFMLTEASRASLMDALSENVVQPTRLVEILEGCTSRVPSTDRSVVRRLQTRLSEFEQECPICNDVQMTDPNLFGCCGYCVCNRCFGMCNNRCPFCRTEVRQTIPAADVEDDDMRAARAQMEETLLRRADEAKYPLKTEAHVSLDPTAMMGNNILANVTHALHYLTHNHHRRILIVLERPSMSMDLSVQLDTHRLSQVTGVVIARIDRMLSGKAQEFTAEKRKFDSPDPAPRALLCYGVNERFMVGTDLASADSIIVVGTIPNNILTQAMSRTLRPNEDRNNARPINQINICCSGT